MGFFDLLLLSIALSLDSGIAAFTQGAYVQSARLIHAVRLAFFFSLFQILMPLIGWGIGLGFAAWVQGIDHWIAFSLLCMLGSKMILDSKKEVQRSVPDLKRLLMLSLATSIDALVAGLSLSFLELNPLRPVVIIGSVTFLASLIGFWSGGIFHRLHRRLWESFAGAVLILLGIKILLEHIGET